MAGKLRFFSKLFLPNWSLLVTIQFKTLLLDHRIITFGCLDFRPSEGMYPVWHEIRSSHIHSVSHRLPTMAQGQSCPVTSFCMACELKMVFIIFKRLKKAKRRRVFPDSGQSYGIYRSASINKVLLEHGRDVVGTCIAHDCFCVTTAELLGPRRYGLQSLRYILWAFYGKSLPTLSWTSKGMDSPCLSIREMDSLTGSAAKLHWYFISDVGFPGNFVISIIVGLWVALFV